MGRTIEIERLGDKTEVQVVGVFDDRMLLFGNTGFTIIMEPEHRVFSAYEPDGSSEYLKEKAPINTLALLGAFASLRSYLQSEQSRKDHITAGQLCDVYARCNTQMAFFAEKLGITTEVSPSKSAFYDFDVTMDLSRISTLPDDDPLIQKITWAKAVLARR